MSLGTYPEASLADAREYRTKARKQVAAGIDPCDQRKLDRALQEDAAANTFEAVMYEWLALMVQGHKQAANLTTITARLKNDVVPFLGKRPISLITPAEVLVVVERVAGRGAVEIAHRELSYISEIMRFAVGKRKILSDPTGWC